MSRPKCPICGKIHGTLSAEHSMVLSAANSNFQIEPRPTEPKRMSAREAMALTKARYKETFDYLA